MAGNGYKIYTQVNFKLSGVDESVSRAKGRLSELAASMASTREKIAKLESTYGKTAGKRELNAGWAAEKDNYDKLKVNLKAMQEEQKTLNALVKDGTRAYNVLKSAITAQDGMTPKVAEQLRRDIPKVMKNINSLGEGAQEKIRQLAEVMRISEAEVKKFSAGVADAFKPFNAKKGETWGESKAYVDMFEKVGHQLARTSEEYDKMAQHAAASRENMAKIEGVIRHTADAENEYVESLKAQIREEQKLQKIQGTKNADSDQRILSRMREQQLQSELGQHYANMLDKDSRKNLSTDQLQEALKGTRQWMEETKRYEEGLKAEYEKYLTWKQDPNHNRLVSEKEYKDALEREQLMQKESTQLEMQLRDQRIADNQKVVDAWKSQQQELMAQGKITSVSQDKVVLEEDYKRAATALKADTEAKIANAEATEKMTYDLRVYQEQQKAGLDFGRDKQLSEWNASYMAQQSQREAAERVLNKDIEEGTALLNQRTKATNEWTGADQAAHAAAKAESEELKSSNAEIIRQVEQNRTAYSEQVGEVRRVAEEKRNAARQELDDAQAVLSANNKLADINERNRQKQANADTRSALLVEAEGLRAEYKALREEKAAANAAESAALGQIKSKQDEIVNKERELVELKKQSAGADDAAAKIAEKKAQLAELQPKANFATNTILFNDDRKFPFAKESFTFEIFEEYKQKFNEKINNLSESVQKDFQDYKAKADTAAKNGLKIDLPKTIEDDGQMERVMDRIRKLDSTIEIIRMRIEMTAAHLSDNNIQKVVRHAVSELPHEIQSLIQQLEPIGKDLKNAYIKSFGSEKYLGEWINQAYSNPIKETIDNLQILGPELHRKYEEALSIPSFRRTDEEKQIVRDYSNFINKLKTQIEEAAQWKKDLTDGVYKYGTESYSWKEPFQRELDKIPVSTHFDTNDLVKQYLGIDIQEIRIQEDLIKDDIKKFHSDITKLANAEAERDALAVPALNRVNSDVAKKGEIINTAKELIGQISTLKEEIAELEKTAGNDAKIKELGDDLKRMKDELRQGFSDSAKTALSELDQLGEKVAQSKGMKFNVDSEDFKTKLTTAIQEAERVLADPKATQEMKDNIVRSINQAVTEAKGFTGLHALDIAGKDEAAQNALGRITTSLEKVTTATQTAQGELQKMGGALPQELIDKEQQLAEKTADYAARAKELHASERAVIEIENKIATAKENRLAAVRKVREIEEQLNKDLTNMSDAQIEKQNRLMEQYDRQKQKIEDLDKTIAQLDEKRNARTMTEEGSLEQLGKQKTRRGGSITFSEIEKIGQPALKAIDELWKQIAKDLKEVNDRTAEQNAKLEQAKIIRKAIKAEEARRAATSNRTVTDLEKEFAATNKDFDVATGKLRKDKERRFEQEMQDLNKILRNTAGYSEDELKRAIELSQKIVNTKSLAVTKEEKLKEAMFLGNEELRKRAQLTTKENMETQLGKDNKFLQRMSDDSLQKQLNYWREMEKAERDNGKAVGEYYNKVKAITEQMNKNSMKDMNYMLTASKGEETVYKRGTLKAEDLIGLNATQLKEMQTNIQNLLNFVPTGKTDIIKEYNSDLKVLKDQLDVLKTGEGARQFETVWEEALSVLRGDTHMTVDDIKKLEKELETLKGGVKTNETITGIDGTKEANKVKEIGKAIGKLKGMYGEAKYGYLTDEMFQKIKAAAGTGARELRNFFDKNKVSAEEMRQALKRLRDEMNENKNLTVNSLTQMGVAAQRLDKQVKDLISTEKAHMSTLENAADRLKNYVMIYVGFQQAVDYVTSKLSKNFELSDEIADIQKVTSMTSEAVGELSNKLTELESRTTHSELMKLAYQGGKMGIGADAESMAYQQQQLASFVNTANQLNMALGEDFGGAAAIASLAKLAKVMRVSEQENVDMNTALEKTGSAILMLGNNSIASYNKISQFATRMGGIASSAHMAMPELLALGSTLDTFGAQSEMAATAMTKMISTLVKQPEKVARAVKAPVEEMQNLIWNGHITEGLELMFHSLKNNGAELEDIANNLKDIVGGGNNTRAMQVLTEMANGADTFTQHLQMAREAFVENTLVSEEYYIKNTTAQAYLLRSQNLINEQFVNSKAVEWFTEVTKALYEWLAGLDNIPLRFATIAAGLWTFIKTYKSGMALMEGITMGTLSRIWGGFVGTFKAIAHPKTAFKNITASLKNIGWVGQNAFSAIANRAKLAWNTISRGSVESRAAIVKDFNYAKSVLVSNMPTLTGLFRGLRAAIVSVGGALLKLAASMAWMMALQYAFTWIYSLIDDYFSKAEEREKEAKQNLADIAAMGQEEVKEIEKDMQKYKKTLEDVRKEEAMTAEERKKAAAAAEAKAKAEQELTEKTHAHNKAIQDAIKVAKQEQTDVLSANEAYIKAEEAKLEAKDAVIEKTYEQIDAEQALADAQLAQVEAQKEYYKALAADRELAARQANGEAVDRTGTTSALAEADKILHERRQGVTDAEGGVKDANAQAKKDLEDRVKRLKELNEEGVNLVAMMGEINALDRRAEDFSEKRDAIVGQYEAQAKATNELLTQREQLIKAGADYKQVEADIAKAEIEVTQAVNEMFDAYDAWNAERQKGAEIDKQIAMAEASLSAAKVQKYGKEIELDKLNNPTIEEYNGVIAAIDKDLERSKQRLAEAGNAFTKWWWGMDVQMQQWRKNNFIKSEEQNKKQTAAEKRRYAEEHAHQIESAKQGIANADAQIANINRTIDALKEQKKAQDEVTESAKGKFVSNIKKYDKTVESYNDSDIIFKGNDESINNNYAWDNQRQIDINYINRKVASDIYEFAIAAGQLKTELENAGASYADYLSMTAGKTQEESAAVKQLLLDRAALTKAGADYAKVEAEQAEAVKKITDAFNAYQTSVEAQNVAQKNLADTQKELKDAEAELAKETAALAQAEAALNDPMKDKWVQGHKEYKEAKKALTAATKEQSAAIAEQTKIQNEINRIQNTEVGRKQRYYLRVANHNLAQANKEVTRTTNEMAQAQKNLQSVADRIGADSKHTNNLILQVAAQKEAIATTKEHVAALKEQEAAQSTTLATAQEGANMQAHATVEVANAYKVEIDAIKTDEDVTKACTEAKAKIKDAAIEEAKAHAEATGKLNESATATDSLINKEKEDKDAKEKQATATEAVNDAEERRKELINDLNRQYTKYIGFIMSETSKMYKLADAIALVTARRQEDALAQSMQNINSEVDKKYGEKGRDAGAEIMKGILDNNRNLSTKEASKLAATVQKEIDSFVKDYKGDLNKNIHPLIQRISNYLNKGIKIKGDDGKDKSVKIDWHDINKGAVNYAKNQQEANKYAEQSKAVLESKLEDAKAESRKVVQEFRNEMNWGAYKRDDNGNVIKDKNGKPVFEVKVPIKDVMAQMAKLNELRGNAKTMNSKEAQDLADAIKKNTANWGIKQQEALLAKMEKSGQFNSEDLAAQRTVVANAKSQQNKMLVQNKSAYSDAEWKAIQEGSMKQNEDYIYKTRIANGYGMFQDIKRQDDKQVAAGYKKLGEAWSDVSPLKPEDIKALNAKLGTDFGSFEEAKAGVMDLKKQFEDQAHDLKMTTELQWEPEKKDKTASEAKKKKNEEEKWAKERYEAYVKELDDYYTKEQTKIEKQRAEGLTSQEQYQRQTEKLENEHLDRRSRLRSQFVKSGKNLTKKEMEILFKDNGTDIRKTGDLLLRMGDAMKDEIQLKSDQDYNKIAESYRKHRDALEKVFEEDNPFLKLFNSTRKAMTELGALLTEGEELDPVKASQMAQQRMAFLMGWVNKAYTSSAEQLIADIKANPELSPWAAMLEQDPKMAEALVIKTRNMYDEIQDAVKKEANRMKKDTDYFWNFVNEDGKSIKDRYEEETAAIERTQHAIEQYNQAYGGGYLAGRKADNLAMAALKSKLRMQQDYLELLRKEGEIRIANAQKAVDDAKDDASREIAKQQLLNTKQAYGQIVKDTTKAVLDAENAIEDKMTDMHYKMVSYIKSWGDWLGKSIGTVMNGYGTEVNDKYNQLALNRYYGTGNSGGMVTIIENAGRNPDSKDHPATVSEVYMTENEQLQWEIAEEQRQKQAEAWKEMMDSFSEKFNDAINDYLTSWADSMSVNQQMASTDLNTDATKLNTEAIDRLTEAVSGGSGSDGNGAGSMGSAGGASVGAQSESGGTTSPSLSPVQPMASWSQAADTPSYMTWGGNGNDSGDYLSAPWIQAADAAQNYANTASQALDSVNATNNKDDKKMVASTQNSFSAMIQAANLYGIAYQAVSNDNLNAGQKAAVIGLQAAGQAAMAMLTMDLSKDTAKTASSLPAILAECLKISPIAGAAIFAGLTGLLGAGLAAAVSTVTKSKSQIASITGASSGKLATGMLTYANGRLPIYDDGSLTPSLSQGEGAAARSVAGARYQVQGNDGVDYSAAFEDKLKTKLYKGGAHFGIFSEKKPEIVIGGDDTATILSQYPYLYDGILAVHRGQDPRLSMDFGYIQQRMEMLSAAQKMSVAKAAFGKMPTFASGTLPDGNVAYDNDNDNIASGMNGGSGANMTQTLTLMNQLLTNLVENGVSAGVEITGKHGLDAQTAKYNRWKQRNGLK